MEESEMGNFVVDSTLHNNWKNALIRISTKGNATEENMKLWATAENEAFEEVKRILSKLEVGKKYKIKYSEFDLLTKKFVEKEVEKIIPSNKFFIGMMLHHISSVEEIPAAKGGKRKSIKNNRKNNRKNHRNNRSKKNRKNRSRY
jgi:hypothetical protein